MPGSCSRTRKRVYGRTYQDITKLPEDIARFWLESKRNPEAAMDLGLPEEEKKPRRKKKRRKAAAAPAKPVEEAPEEG